MSSKRKVYHTRQVRHRRAKWDKTKRCILIISGAAIFILLLCVVSSFLWKKELRQTGNESKVLPKITIDTQLIQKNKYSRPGIALKEVNAIVVHYTANPGTNALDNRNYFNNLPKINQDRQKPIYASSHFVIGLEGQIVQCIPLSEISYASNERNNDTISIECCHPDKSGKFNETTYKALVELLAYLCIKYNLSTDDIIRHYDVTGKQCPLYFVQHEDEWEQLKNDVLKKVA